MGVDEAPVRWIVLQLLHSLNRRLKTTPDGFGLKSSLSGYLSQFKSPKIDLGVGAFNNQAAATQPESASVESTPAKDHSKTEAAAVAAPVNASVEEKPATPEKPDTTTQANGSDKPTTGSIVFNKPRERADLSSTASEDFPVPEFIPDLSDDDENAKDEDFIETVVHSESILNGSKSTSAQTNNIAQAAENAANAKFAETLREESPLIEPQIETINQKSSTVDTATQSNGQSTDGEYIETVVHSQPTFDNPEPFPQFQPGDEKKPESFTSTIPQ